MICLQNDQKEQNSNKIVVNVLVAVSSHCYLFPITCKCRGGGSFFFYHVSRFKDLHRSPEERLTVEALFARTFTK